MLLIPAPFLKLICDAAEAAYPAECCGLLAGRPWQASETPQHPLTDDFVVTRVEPSANVSTGDQADSFEVDPAVRFRLMRELDGTGSRMIGHYHSHPDHPAAPSARDLSQAYEPDLIWLITSVIDGQAVLTTAHAVDENNKKFESIGLRTTGLTQYSTPQRYKMCPGA